MQLNTPTIELFRQISAVPRGSKQEEKIRLWLVGWAEAHGFAHKTDAAGNLVVCVPASPGAENKPVIVIQTHMDMVCQKTPDNPHDFTRDPIELVVDGDWLKAAGTTLGADNGIGMALALAVAEDRALRHPPLELLFTVEEELGIAGASRLDPSLLTGKILVNLDSEEEGAFTVGCAGGTGTYITLPVAWQEPGPAEEAFELNAGGLLGGHSGEDISLQRGNAIKLAARIMGAIQREVPVRLAEFVGGSARNAIPRDARVVFLCPGPERERCQGIFSAIRGAIQAEYAGTEPGISLRLEEAREMPRRAVSAADTGRALDLLVALPHGVSAYSTEIPGFVETSNNIGVIELKEEGLCAVSNQRSSVLSRLEELTQRLEALARLAGARAERSNVYAPWKANPASPLLARSIETYTAVFGTRPHVRLSHGGLECGIISERCGGLDALSLGPTIRAPHSPSEALFVPSVERIWQFLVGLLASF